MVPMAPPPLTPVLDRLREALHGMAGVRLAAAFGSVARGEEHAGSDVDLGLLLDPPSDAAGTDVAATRTAVESALARAAGRTIDLVPLGDAPPLLRFEIARDGVLLLERHAGDWADFRARAMIDWWDWAPTARRINQAVVQRLRTKLAATHGPS